MYCLDIKDKFDTIHIVNIYQSGTPIHVDLGSATNLENNEAIQSVTTTLLSKIATFAVSQDCRYSSVKELCLFITLFIEGYPVTMLVDTGAGKSMMHNIVLGEVMRLNPELRISSSDYHDIRRYNDYCRMDRC